MVFNYFLKSLKEYRLFPKDENEIEQQAAHAFRRDVVEAMGDNSPDFEGTLQAWIDTYIPQPIWNRCLTALRQRRFDKAKEARTLKLSRENYRLVKAYAQALNLTVE